MELLVLGPVEARTDGRQITLGAAKQRAVLAMLSLRANSMVSADELMEGLWGEHPPATAAKMVQQYVSQLRRLLAEGDGRATAIVTRGRGYELRIPPDDVDALRFTRLVERGAARQALALWRGRALDDIADEPFAAAEIRRLEELRLNALEQAIDDDLADGRHRELVAELEALVAEHHLSERLHGQLMLALYRSGRQAEALEAYRRARELLVDEVGIEPGPDLQRLHAAMLDQDASLDAPPRPELPPELAISSPMFGREAELARLRAAWARAQDGSGGVLVISGPPGSGRTRLAAELAAEVHEQRGEVLYGRRGVEAARRAVRPALLVVEDGEAAPPECAGIPVLCVATNGNAAAPGAERIELGPVGEDAIAAIARLHGLESEAAALVEASRGVPREAHRIAADWAREQAERRVSAEAARTADERAGLRRAESRLRGRVTELQTVRERTERHAAGAGTVVCPYKGLASFGRDDADFFFGRERLVADLVARLVGSPLVGIVGASGSGKSSLLRAGLLAELRKGVLPGSDAWRQVLMRPGEYPEAMLRQATAAAQPDRRLLIAVDQFEEAFTLCRDASERAGFLRGLVAAAMQQDAAVVLALRADFYGRCAEDPELASLLGDNQLLVGAMRRDELRRAIEMPAERAGLEVEPELVDALLADTADEPGALPLLSTALLELWQRRDGSRLHLAAYERTGGVRGAVARLAETAYGRLDPDQQRDARRIFLRLAGDAADGVRVRRRVPLGELEADRVLDRLADSRLVTVSEGTAEVAHEALLREWPRLRGWLEEDADGRRLHAHLTHAARDWNRDDRDRGELYRGARLASALEWRAGHEPELNAIEQQFLDASRVASERARRRIKLVLAGVVALLVLTAGAALLALDQRGRANAQTQAAEAQRLGAQAVNADTLDFSLLLARQGVALENGLPTQASLLAALRRSPAAVGVIRPGISSLVAIDQPAGGGALAVSDFNGAIAFLDPATRRRLALRRPAAGTLGGPLASAPDGSRTAAAGFDSQGAFVELFDPRTQRHLTRVRLNIYFEGAQTMVFSPDSRELLVQANDPEGGNGLWRVDARSGRMLPGVMRERGIIGSAIRLPGDAQLLGFAGSRLVTFSPRDSETVVRDPATLRADRRLPYPAPVAKLNTALGVVAFGGEDGTVRLLDVRTGRMRTGAGRHDAPVTALAFSLDGRTLVTAGRDEQVIVWDTRRAAPTETLPARGAGVIDGLAVDADGRTAFSAGRDGTVVIWDLQGDGRLERPLLVNGRSLGGRLLLPSSHGGQFAVVDPQGSIDVFDSRTLSFAGRIPLAGSHRPRGAAVSPDGGTLAVTDLVGRVAFWDLRTRRRLGEPQYAHASREPSLSFSGDGRWLVTGVGGDIMRLWDVRRRMTRDSLPFNETVDLSLNAQGTLVAAVLDVSSESVIRTGAPAGLEIISVPKLEVVRRVAGPRGTVARFTPDGRSLIYGDREGRVWVYDTRTWKPRRAPLLVTSPIFTADISPDGQQLATTSADGEARLWDLATGRSIGGALPSGRGGLVGAGFIDGGRRMAVLHDRGGYAWDLDPASWARHACSVAGRTLTRAEWNSALPGRRYAPACTGR